MTAQQTLFSLSRWVLADHGAIIGDAVSQEQGIGKPVHFCKVVIPRQSKLQFLRRLHQMNITGSSLFPGIDGLGRSLSELTKIAASDASRGGAIDATAPEPRPSPPEHQPDVVEVEVLELLRICDRSRPLHGLVDQLRAHVFVPVDHLGLGTRMFSSLISAPVPA